MDLQQRHISVWSPCYHSLACPQVSDSKDGLQIWRIAADVIILNKKCGLQIWRIAADVIILNKKSQAADRRWFSG